MNDILGKMLAGLAGALLCWFVARYYNRPRLYCAPSRLYGYSNLVDGSSTVQLVIANRGRKAEEAVEVQLSTEYGYHLLAATENGIEIPKEKRIRLPVLLPKSEVSLIFVAEGKPRFSKDGIRQIKSKTAIGIVGSSLAEAESSSPGALFAAFLFLLITAFFGYGLGKTVGEDLWRWGEKRLLPVIEQPFAEGCLTTSSNGDGKSKRDGLTEDQLRNLALNAISLKRVSTQKDELQVEIEIENPAKTPIEYRVALRSHASDSTTDWRKRNNTVYDVIIVNKGETRTYVLGDFFPADRTPKRFWLEIRVEVLDYWVTLKRAYYFGPDVSKTCSAP